MVEANKQIALPHDQRNAADIFEAAKPIAVVDRIQIKPGNQRSVYHLMTHDYAMHVAARGLRLVGAWLSPPFDQPDVGSELTLIWEHDSVAAFWKSRALEQQPDAIIDGIWARVGELIYKRTRRLARSAPMQITPPDDRSVIQVNFENIFRTILILLPRISVSPADRPAWVAAAESLAEADGDIVMSRMGFHQDQFSDLPQHFTWEVAARRPINEAALLCKLPGAATVVDALELGEVLDEGRRQSIGVGLKRTLLARAETPDPSEVERLFAGLPRYISALRNWRLSRVSSSRGAHAWTHCFETEVRDVSDFFGDYINHPYHWAVADRLAQREEPGRVITAACHTVYSISRSVLAELHAPLR